MPLIHVHWKENLSTKEQKEKIANMISHDIAKIINYDPERISVNYESPSFGGTFPQVMVYWSEGHTKAHKENVCAAIQNIFTDVVGSMCIAMTFLVDMPRGNIAAAGKIINYQTNT